MLLLLLLLLPLELLQQQLLLMLLLLSDGGGGVHLHHRVGRNLQKKFKIVIFFLEHCLGNKVFFPPVWT